MENPEQNFGILAIETRTKTIDGKLNDWQKIPEFENENFIIADEDPGYFYLAAYLPGFDFSKNNLHIAFDTYDKEKGDHKLPFLNKEMKYGIEFLVELKSLTDAKILIDDQYSLFTDIIKNIIPVYASKKNSNGKFIEELLITNREKETLKGEKLDSICFNRSKLQFGNSGKPEYSNADWYWDDKTKILELRLTWALLNVSDPSSRSVLDDVKGTPAIEYTETPGFNIFYYITDKKDKLIDEETGSKPYFFTWDTWEIPEYKERLKPIYDTLALLFNKLNVPPKDPADQEEVTEKFSVCRFYENKEAAISITFDDADYSQFEYALPVLGKYALKANFGIVGSWLNDSPSLIAEDGSFAIKRLGLLQVQDIIYEGHEVSFHGFYHKNYNDLSLEEITKEFKEAKENMEKKLGIKIPVIHYPFSSSTDKVIKAAQNAGFLFGRTGEKNAASNNNSDFMKLNSVVFLNSKTPTINQLDSILAGGKNAWTIFLYHHLFPQVSKEFNLYKSHNVENTYTVTPIDFVRQIRLIRNSGYWISTISSIGKYIKERDNAVIKTTKNASSVFLRVNMTLDADIYNYPLTIKFETNNKKFRITNCAADGIYNARDHKLFFNVYPNQDVTIEILD
jgi:peptidoglycan/xylan/chitin deacetylase (PgdA/CDA1 family)